MIDIGSHQKHITTLTLFILKCNTKTFGCGTQVDHSTRVGTKLHCFQGHKTILSLKQSPSKRFVV